MEYIDAKAARELFPKVKGDIFGAVLFSGFAVLDMGVGAIAAMVAGKMIACCPTFDHAVTAGRKEADRQDAERRGRRVERWPIKKTGPSSRKTARPGALWCFSGAGSRLPDAKARLMPIGLRMRSTMKSVTRLTILSCTKVYDAYIGDGSKNVHHKKPGK